MDTPRDLQSIMTPWRFFTIILIFLGATIAWLTLGGTVYVRTEQLDRNLSEEVDALWGPAGLVQVAPTPNPVKSEVKADFHHEFRYKGLLWFSTYIVDFTGTYTVAATSGPLAFRLPSAANGFDNLSVKVNDEPVDVASAKVGNTITVSAPAGGGETYAVTVVYRTQGRDTWEYDLGTGEDTTLIRDFTLTATTDFPGIDYPKGTRSPTPEPHTATDAGATAVWHYENKSTRERVGVAMPSRENAGPIAARMAYYAPVSLLFFFTVMFTIMVLKRTPLHPMHYLFISAGFFAFHILLAYLVDHIGIHAAFWMSAAVSVLLVVSYMRLVAGGRFAVVYAGAAQLVYLVGFSYAFFWTGFTGLTIVVVAIVTLFVLMQATGRLDWAEVFARQLPAGKGMPGA